MSSTGFGAYTGEVTAEHLKDFGIEWVIIGHSERRNVYGETDADVALKVKRSQDLKLNALVCIGE